MAKTFKNITEQKAQVRKNIRESIRREKEEEQALNESVDMYADMEKNKIFNKASMHVQSKLHDDKVIKKKIEDAKYNNELVFPKLFASAVFESMDISDEDKLANVKLIFEKAEGVFNEGVKAGVLDVEGSPIFNNVFEYAKTQTNAVGSRMTPEQVISTVKHVYKKNDVELGYLKERVADKVAKAVFDERQLTNIKEGLMESDSYYEESKTLFRTLHEMNIDKLMEDETLMEHTDGNEDTINSFAFAETILDYTILEMINTSGLIDVSNKDLHKNITSMITHGTIGRKKIK